MIIKASHRMIMLAFSRAGIVTYVVSPGGRLISPCPPGAQRMINGEQKPIKTICMVFKFSFKSELRQARKIKYSCFHGEERKQMVEFRNHVSVLE